MKNFVKEEAKEIRGIFGRMKRRDFRYNTGIAIKNSTYQLTTNMINKGGSLLFTVILARMLSLELFGLYSLALSTILLFALFSDLGIGQAVIRYVSKGLNKNQLSKTKSILVYLIKIKFLIILVTSLFLLISAWAISHTYYNKPIFLALLAGVLYIIFISLSDFLKLFFQAVNNFKILFFNEIFFQVARIVLVPLIVLYSLKSVLNPEQIIAILILALAFICFLNLLFLWCFIGPDLRFLKEKPSLIKKQEMKNVNSFILGALVISLSGLLFGYIDIIFLGRFVSSELIGSYQVAFSLSGALAPLIAFANVLLPIFSRMNGKRLEKGFKKSVKMTFVISIFFFLLLFIFASPIIRIMFGEGYTLSSSFLRVLSLLVLSTPIISVYSAYFIAKGRTQILSKLLIASMVFNIFLDYIFIISLIAYSQTMAVFGVIFATIISRGLYLFTLIVFKKFN